MSRSHLLGLLLVLAGAVTVTVGVALFSIPAAVVLAGLLVAAFGVSLLIEVRP